MNKSKAIAVVTFAGAAGLCVLVASSYPVAIWGIGFAAIFKLTHPESHHATCPLLEAARERGESSHVVATNRRENRAAYRSRQSV